MRRSRTRSLLLVPALPFLAACSSEGPGTCNPTEPGCGSGDPEVSTIEVEAPIDTVMAVGGATQLAASAFDATGGPVSVSFEWTSTADAVATVDGDGSVSAVGVGTARIEASAEQEVGSWALRVVDADLGAVTALLSDPFTEALIGSLDADAGSSLTQAIVDCEAAVDAGDVLEVDSCLDEAGALTSSASADGAALGILDLFFQESSRKLRLDG